MDDSSAVEKELLAADAMLPDNHLINVHPSVNQLPRGRVRGIIRQLLADQYPVSVI